MCVSEYRHFGLMLKATGLLALLISSKVWVSYSSAFLLALPVRRRPPVGHLGSAPPSLTDWDPSWKSIEQQLFSTDKGRRPHELKKERLNGRGPPNARATLRLFHETDESNVNVTFYRDVAAWCPYCQKASQTTVHLKTPFISELTPYSWSGVDISGGTSHSISSQDCPSECVW
jgi:hypothetical protein